MAQTEKKVKVVGSETYINQKTGEVQEFQVIDIEDRDANFQKLWLGHILEAIDEIGNAKMKVLMHLLSKRDINNRVIATQQEIAEATGVHRQTVMHTVAKLAEHNILTKRRNIPGVFMLNPDVIFKGSRGSRLNVLLRYREWQQMELPGVAEEAPESEPEAV